MAGLRSSSRCTTTAASATGQLQRSSRSSTAAVQRDSSCLWLLTLPLAAGATQRSNTQTHLPTYTRRRLSGLRSRHACHGAAEAMDRPGDLVTIIFAASRWSSEDAQHPLDAGRGGPPRCQRPEQRTKAVQTRCASRISVVCNNSYEALTRSPSPPLVALPR